MPGLMVSESFCEVSVLTLIYQAGFDALLGCQALGDSGDPLRTFASHSGGEGLFCRSKTVSFWTSKKISFNCLGPKQLHSMKEFLLHEGFSFLMLFLAPLQTSDTEGGPVNVRCAGCLCGRFCLQSCS